MYKTYSEVGIKVPRFNEESGFYTTDKPSKITSKILGKNAKRKLRPIVNFGFSRLSKIWKGTLK